MLREAGALISLLIITSSLHGGVKWAAAAAAAGGDGGGERVLRIENRCETTVWPGLLPNAGQPLLAGGGFELAAGHSRDVAAPPGWSGRLWGRTGCPTNTTTSSSSSSSSLAANANAAAAACETGDCGGGRLQCGGAGASPPATLAELTLAPGPGPGPGGRDFYDVSLVDGFNLPISIAPTTTTTTTTTSISSDNNYTCGVAGCSANLNLACPSELQMLLRPRSSVVVVVGCNSACRAFGTDAFCCAGAYASPGACTPSPYARAFKRACPAAYSYAFDDPTSTFTCAPYASASAIVNYAIVFCPASLSQKNANAAPLTSSLNNVYIQSFFGLFLSFFFTL